MDESSFDVRLASLLAQHPTEADFHALCELFRTASPAQRERLRRVARVGDGSWRTPRAATLADGTPHDLPPAERVRDALLWHAIEGGDFDPRDNLMSIVLVYHAARRLGLDVEALFDEAAALAPPRMAGTLSSFPRRAPEDRSLRAFHYREVPTATGVRYEPTDS